MRANLPAAIVAFIGLAVPGGIVAMPRSGPDAAGIVTELNRVRADPAAYARELEPFRARFHGRVVRDPGQPVDRITNEGVAALNEAIRQLRRQPASGPLLPNDALVLAARDHVRDQGPAGQRGHDSRDGSSPLDRVMRHGLRPFMVGEVISYGPTSAREVVRELIIDDGVPDRGHRRAIFNAGFARAGAACGRHAGYGTMCVVDMAGNADAPGNARPMP